MTFEYDPFGSRVRKVTPQQETLTIGGLYERRTTSDAVTHVFYAHGSEGPVAQLVRRKSKVTETRAMEYLARDAHGSVGLVFDKSGKEIKGGRLYFDPFGRRIDEAGAPVGAAIPGNVTLGFTGHEHDAELGLINMGGRVYDPLQRRFLTPDPFISDLGFGPAYNRYTYTEGNPLRWVDPTGFSKAQTPMGPPLPPGPSGCESGTCGQDSAPPPIKDLPGVPEKGNPAQGSTEAGVTPPSGGTSEQGPSMSDAPSADASGGGGLWGSFKRFVGNVELARQGFYAGGIEAAISTAASIGVMAQHPIFVPPSSPATCAGSAVGPAAAPPPEEAPALMVTGHPSADFMMKYDPVTQLAAGFVFAGREMWRGHWFEGGYMLAQPEAELSMIAFGVVIGGGGATSKGVPQIGGTYSSVRAAATEAGLGGQAHHMPSWAATEGAGVPGATRTNTPTIWLETADHLQTASHGKFGTSAAIHRARQQALIAQGRYLDAMMMDVENIRSLFGSKYDGAIQQMGEAFWRANQ